MEIARQTNDTNDKRGNRKKTLHFDFDSPQVYRWRPFSVALCVRVNAAIQLWAPLCICNLYQIRFIHEM